MFSGGMGYCHSRSSCNTAEWSGASFARMYGPIPPRYHRALYGIASGVTLAAVALVRQPSGNHLLVLGSGFRRVTRALAICAFALFLWGALALRELEVRHPRH